MEKVKFVQIEPTNRCNFKCGFCYGRHLEPRDMSFDVYKSIIEKLPNLYHIELQGEGEPFLHPQIYDMAMFANKRNIKVSTVTNGSFFSSENINRILESGFEAIRISIESPYFNEFREIRGGDLKFIINGIALIIEEKSKRNLAKPIVGFAVTVLKKTKNSLAEIARIYNELNMDGGIGVQPLNPFKQYTRYYNESISNEILSNEERLEVISERNKIDNLIRKDNSIKHYSDDILTFHSDENAEEDKLASTSSISESLYFISCHNLDKSLYIDSEGFVSGCCAIKDRRYSFGKIDEDSFESIINKRNHLRGKIRGGLIPTCCMDCTLAQSISNRLSKLLNKKPIIKKSIPLETISLNQSKNNILLGEVFNHSSTFQLLLQLCDGKETCLGLIQKVAQIKQIDLEEARILALPALNELFRQEIIQ